eukprot:3932258-Rhodomonas_salina.6
MVLPERATKPPYTRGKPIVLRICRPMPATDQRVTEPGYGGTVESGTELGCGVPVIGTELRYGLGYGLGYGGTD